LIVVLLVTATLGLFGDPITIKLRTIFVLEIRVVETEPGVAASRGCSERWRGGRHLCGTGGRGWSRATKSTTTRTPMGNVNLPPFLITALQWLFGNPITGQIAVLLEAEGWVIEAGGRRDHRGKSVRGRCGIVRGRCGSYREGSERRIDRGSRRRDYWGGSDRSICIVGTVPAAGDRALGTFALIGTDTLAFVRCNTMFLGHCADNDLGLVGFRVVITNDWVRCCALIDGLCMVWSLEVVHVENGEVSGNPRAWRWCNSCIVPILSHAGD